MNDAVVAGAPEDGAPENVESWSGKGRTAENFPVGSVLVRADLRRHVHAFYDFARNADDIADSPVLEAQDKLARLGVMEAVLLGTRDGGSPSALGLRESLAVCGVSAVHAQELLRAFRRDAVKSRYTSWADLYAYCRYSAMPVGRHVLDLHGEDQATWAASDALCAVLQVLNHVQDMARDLRALDRCYLPADRMAAHGVVVADLRRPRASPGLRALIDELLGQCEALNQQARGLPRGVKDRRLRLETAIIVGLSQRLARRLKRGDPLAGRVKLRAVDVVGAVVGAVRFLP